MNSTTFPSVKTAWLSGTLAALLCMPAQLTADINSATRLDGDVYADPAAAMEHFSMVDNEEMDIMRGGFRVAGMDIQFGVNLRTTGTGFAREAMYTLNSTTGAFDQVSNTLVTDDTISAPVHLVGTGTGLKVSDIVGSGVNLGGLENATGGIVISDDTGFTAILEQLTQDSIISALVTDANSQEINHQLNVDITIENFSEYAEAARGSVLTRSLGSAVQNLSAPR